MYTYLLMAPLVHCTGKSRREKESDEQEKKSKFQHEKHDVLLS